jgi:hypothetical protein
VPCAGLSIWFKQNQLGNSGFAGQKLPLTTIDLQKESVVLVNRNTYRVVQPGNVALRLHALPRVVRRIVDAGLEIGRVGGVVPRVAVRRPARVKARAVEEIHQIAHDTWLHVVD